MPTKLNKVLTYNRTHPIVPVIRDFRALVCLEMGA